MTRNAVVSNETIELSRSIRQVPFNVCPKSNRWHVRDEMNFAHAPGMTEKEKPGEAGL
ncbi:hypothetical protein [Bradyrhizobium icense]|uniref:hypothetical protein n=1 Tax=Bradyrhizobium icense TaxID=1274631 RepID=UPI0012E9E951|nr:hypothetical protein [Bradyrhizobium icense]